MRRSSAGFLSRRLTGKIVTAFVEKPTQNWTDAQFAVALDFCKWALHLTVGVECFREIEGAWSTFFPSTHLFDLDELMSGILGMNRTAQFQRFRI